MDTMNHTDTPTTNPIRLGATVWDTNDTARTRTVANDPSGAIVLEEGEFLILSYHGYHTIGRLTGRTRQFWHMACPTIERFEVETYATPEGVIMGRRGERIPGTMAVRAENVK